MIFDVSFSALLRVSTTMGVCSSGNPTLCFIALYRDTAFAFGEINLLFGNLDTFIALSQYNMTAFCVSLSEQRQ